MRKPRPKPAPSPKPTLLVSNNLPKIMVRPHGDGVRLTIPGYNRDTVALAHAIVAIFLGDISEHVWTLIMTPRVDPGDRLMTCTMIGIDLIRVLPIGTVEPSAFRARTQTITDLLRDAAVRACRPGYTRHSTHNVLVLEDP